SRRGRSVSAVKVQATTGTARMISTGTMFSNRFIKTCPAEQLSITGRSSATTASYQLGSVVSPATRWKRSPSYDGYQSSQVPSSLLHCEGGHQTNRAVQWRILHSFTGPLPAR